jgi:ABC-type transport system involved in cytochrome c biogenesis permease subunit
LEGITRLCFGASYAVAFGLESVRLVRPQTALRAVAMLFGFAGLFAHTVFLALQRPTLQSTYGSLLFLAWVLAVFYLYGTVHHRRFAWAVFVLPLVLGLVVLAGYYSPEPGAPPPPPWSERIAAMKGDQFWGGIHGTLILLAAVGVSVGFLASVMYLLQARRLRAKTAPSSGFRLLSLERLEEMNRRAINVAFPLLTVGLLVGVVLMMHHSESMMTWTAAKFIGTAGLWLLFLVLMILRYGLRSRGRLLAFGTIAAFVVMLATLAASHPNLGGLP